MKCNADAADRTHEGGLSTAPERQGVEIPGPYACESTERVAAE